MNSPVLKFDVGRQRYHLAQDQPSLAGIIASCDCVYGT
jgi:hypothetical protein